MARLLAANSAKVDASFRIGYPKTVDTIRYDWNAAKLNPGVFDEWDFLTHWTRSAQGPFPGQDQFDHYDAVLNSSDYPGSAFSLANSTDEIYLYAGPDIRATRVDRVVYDGGKRFPDPTGASMMLMSTSMSSSGNDNGSAWCTSTSHIGGDPAADLGTPGAANDRC